MRAYGSDLPSLVSVIRGRRWPLAGAPGYFAASLLSGTPYYGADTPYRQIRLLRRGEGLRIGADGRVATVEILGRDALWGRPASSADIVEQIGHEVCAHVRAAAKASFSNRFAHLTGGIDSRLVLAALLHEGLQDAFVFSCIKGSKDWEIAHALTGELGLTLASHEGSPTGTGYARNYAERCWRAARNSAAAIPSGIEPAWVPSDSLVFQGGYGEVMRSFNSFCWEGEREDLWGLCHSLWRYASCGFPAREAVSASIWSPEFLQQVSDRVRIFVDEAEQLGLPDHGFTNYLYVEGRNRNWIGLQSFYGCRTRAQYDPLYSTIAPAAALWLSPTERMANLIGIDLMRWLAPELIEYPFGGARIPAGYERLRGAVPRRTYRSLAPKQIDSPASTPKPWPGAVDHFGEAEQSIASALGLSTMTVHGVRRLAPAALAVVRELPELRQIYRPEGLEALWNAGEPSDATAYQKLHGVIHGLLLEGRLEHAI